MEDESPSYKPSKNCKGELWNGFEQKESFSAACSNCVCKTVDVLSAEDPRQPQAEDSDVMNAAFQEEDDEPSNSQTEEKLPGPTSDQPLALSISSELNFLPFFFSMLSFLPLINSYHFFITLC